MADTPDPSDESGENVARTPEGAWQHESATGGTPATLFVGAQYTGPLPTPQMLGDYNSVLPGLAERIVRMAEKEQDHGHKMDRWYATLRFTGQFAAFVIAMAGLIIGALLIRDGHGIEGLATLLAGLGPVVGAFLYRQIKSSNGT